MTRDFSWRAFWSFWGSMLVIVGAVAALMLILVWIAPLIGIFPALLTIILAILTVGSVVVGFGL